MTKKMIKSSSEISEAKTQIITEQVNIKAVDASNPLQIEITLNRGAAEEIIKNYTILKGESKLVDVFSVVDLSGSMGDCTVYSTVPYCTYDCCKADGTGCQGKSCLYTGTCSNEECGACPGNRSLDKNYLVKNENVCNKTKLNLAKESNIAFVKSILNNSGNRMGLKACQTAYMPRLSHHLSNNTASLNNTISNWTAGSWTCICCGINQAKSDLVANSTSAKSRVMVVMSDGNANIECSEQNTGNAIKDAINASCMANSSGITVYTVGFGSNADAAALQAIADCGGGLYYNSANVSKLSEIYTQIADKITANYEAKLQYYLKIILYNETNSYAYNLPNPPKPLETTAFLIPLNNQIVNVTKIEVYPVIMTESGTQVIGNILDTWNKK